MVNIAEALCAYYEQLRVSPITEAEFRACLSSLPPALQAAYMGRSLAEALQSRAFREYCLDCRGCSRNEFLHSHLSPESYACWEANLEFWDMWADGC